VQRLFRVYAHIYHHHFNYIAKELKQEQELLSKFKLFYYFITHYNLVEKKEMGALEDLIDTFK
jgi:MOB kinase activator 1